MRRMAIVIITISFLCLVAHTPAVAAEKRKLIYEYEGGKVYLNVDSLAIVKRTWGKPPKEFEYATMWIYREYTDASPSKKDGLVSDRELIEIKPGQREWRRKETLRKYVSFEAEMKALKTNRALDNITSTWQAVVPGSLYEVVYNEINKAYKREKSWFKIKIF